VAKAVITTRDSYRSGETAAPPKIECNAGFFPQPMKPCPARNPLMRMRAIGNKNTVRRHFTFSIYNLGGNKSISKSMTGENERCPT
jgi:hypothetical protein